MKRKNQLNSHNKVKCQFGYEGWKKKLPLNLQDTTSYNLKSAYESGLQPELIDGEYHLPSRNPITGEILKFKDHPTFDLAIEEDKKLGYLPYIDNEGKIYTFNKKPNMKKYKPYKKQFGGTSQNILAEDGELYLDENNELQEVNSFSHDDPFIELPNGQKTISSKGNGGQILDDAQSVLSDSYTQVKDGDRKNTNKEQQIVIKSKDAKKLFDYKWFNPGKNKKYSPSELVKEVISQRDKKLSKYSDAKVQDALTLSTNQLNTSLMPDDVELYNVVLNRQEQSKTSGFNNKAQFGTITEDRTTKNFKKKHADVIQDGYDRINYENIYTDRVGENVGDSPEVLDSFDESKGIYKDYVNSDLYKNRIINNTQKLSDLYLTDTRKDKIKEIGNSDLYDVTSGRLNRRIDNIGLNSEFSRNGTLGTYDSTDNVVSVDKNRMDHIDDTVFHEIGHATTPKINSHYLRDGYDLKGRMLNSLQEDLTTNMNSQKYLHSPGEIRSEVMELRKNLHNLGKPITEGNYTKEDLNNLKTNQAYQKLKYVFSDDEIFELVNDLAYNEDQQDPSIAKAQYGGSTYVEKPKLVDKPLSQKELDSKFNFTSENRKWLIDSYVKNNYPEVRYISDIGRPDGRANYIALTGGIHRPNNSEDSYDDDIIEELGHVEQNRKMSDLALHTRGFVDSAKNLFKGNSNPQLSTYDQKGTLEYEAHKINSPRIKDEYDAHILDSQILDRNYELKKKLSTKQYGGIPVNPNGLYEENGPVIIPGNNITMKNIKQNVAAINADTGEYITVMNPEKNYKFNGVKNVLEIPLKKAQTGYDDTSRTPDRRIKIQGTDRTLNPDPIRDDYYVDQYGDVWQKQPNGEFTKTEHRWQETLKPAPASYSEYMTGEDDKYEVRRGDWISSVAPMFGLTESELLDLNPDIKETGKILPGQRINVMKPVENATPPFTPILEPEDRMDEIEGMEELPEEINTTAEDVIPTLDVKAENVPPQGVTQEQSKEIADKIRLGKIDRTQGTNALREMMRANRSINLPYRAETPRRLYDYLEEDATPYLDEIDGQITQATQNINQNTAQGQAIYANVLNRANQAKRQTINRVNQSNLQRRQQIDNANVSLQNQFDMMQEQNNKNYVDETYQTLANYDRNRVQQAEYLDDMINNNTKLNNFFTLENMRNPNYQIDPVTGEIFRIGTPFKQDKKKSQYGIKKKK